MSESEHIKRLRRAWILVRAADGTSAAEQIYGLNQKLDYPRFQVVRADVVDASDDGVDVVVPVWAPDLDGVNQIRAMIEEVPGVEATQLLTVRMGENKGLHHPFPPQKAKGYVTVEEANSPVGPMGANAWG